MFVNIDSSVLFCVVKQLRHLEEIKGYNRSPRSSYESTPSSKIHTSDDGSSSVNSSPRSLQKHCRPIETVVRETQVKGNLIERLYDVEDRLLKLCMEMEEHERESEANSEDREAKKEKKEHKHGLKQLVKSCVKGKGKSSHKKKK